MLRYRGHRRAGLRCSSPDQPAFCERLDFVPVPRQSTRVVKRDGAPAMPVRSSGKDLPAIVEMSAARSTDLGSPWIAGSVASRSEADQSRLAPSGYRNTVLGGRRRAPGGCVSRELRAGQALDDRGGRRSRSSGARLGVLQVMLALSERAAAGSGLVAAVGAAAGESRGGDADAEVLMIRPLRASCHCRRWPRRKCLLAQRLFLILGSWDQVSDLPASSGSRIEHA